MSTPVLSWVFLVLALLGALLTITALFRANHLGWGNAFWFLAGWLTSELAVFHILVSAAIAAVFALQGALTSLPGKLGLAVMVLSWGGLAVAQWRALPAARVLEAALEEGLGHGYRERIPAERRAVLRESIPFAELASPFSMRSRNVEWLRDLPYHEGDQGHERHFLDVYRPRGEVRDAPVLLQIHGGGWTFGNKHEQALPLIYYLVQRGWVVVATNYRLSPTHRFPAHLMDCKRALAWVRENVWHYGGDPSFIAVTGGSAGGHLAALLGLTANDASLQPGFEQVDTRVAACVPFYGVYDFVDRHALRGEAGEMTRWLEKSVMSCSPQEDPKLWDLASPIALVRPDAPPFFVLHGTHDSLAVVEEARLFVERLRAVSASPVVYAELPGAQHAWEIFRSVRAMHSVHAVSRFLEWAHANRVPQEGRQP